MRHLPQNICIQYSQMYHALRLTPQRFITATDVEHSYAIIMETLEQSPTPVWVIVDLKNTPNIPLDAVIDGAVDGPYTDPKLRECLMLGESPIAKLVEKILVSITGRSNVRWFHTEQEVTAYMNAQALPASPQGIR